MLVFIIIMYVQLRGKTIELLIHAHCVNTIIIIFLSLAQYGVIPDMTTGGCLGGCGANPQVLNNLMSVSSRKHTSTLQFRTR